jgi:tRNA threonylcarbamoyladenosine biosynthesis protein TsaE
LQTITYTLDRIDELANLLIQEAGDQKVWIFRGEMGAGKTT